MKKVKELFNIFWVQLYLQLKLQARYVNSTVSSLVLNVGRKFVCLDLSFNHRLCSLIFFNIHSS